MDEIKLSENDLKLALSLSMAPTKFDKYVVLLKNDYGYNLTKSELAKVLDKSVQTIDRRIKEGVNIPEYLKSSEGKKSSYIVPICEVALYLTNTVKVA